MATAKKLWKTANQPQNGAHLAMLDNALHNSSPTNRRDTVTGVPSKAHNINYLTSLQLSDTTSTVGQAPFTLFLPCYNHSFTNHL